MVAQKRNVQFFAPVLENEPEIAVTATLEKLVPQLADTEAAMDMGLAKTIDEITERQEALYSLRLGKISQAMNDRGIDGKDSIQAYLGVASW